MSRASSFPVAVTITAAVAVAGTARLAAFPEPVAIAFGVAAVLRLVFGRRGGDLLGPMARGLLGATGLALGSIFVLHALAGDGVNPLVALLAALTATQTLLLFGPLTPFAGFLLLLDASVMVSGTAFLARDAGALGWTIGAFACLVWSLVLLERHSAALKEERTEGAVRRLKAGPAGRGDWMHARTAVAVVGVALAAGGLLYLGMPRVEGLPRPQFGGDDASDDGAGREEAGNASDRDATFSTFKTGVDRAATGIKLGDVGRIKRDLTPYLAVEARGWGGDLRDLYLRGNVVDTFTAGGWYPALEDGRLVRFADEDDGAVDGWIELGPQDAPSGHDLAITFLEGLTARKEGWNLLFLQPDTVRLRLRRPGRAPASYVTERADLKRFSPWRLAAGDAVDVRVVDPTPSRALLLRARSDAEVAPSPTHVQLPPELAPLRAITLSVVGSETNPWRRAERIEAWLRNEFRYTLNVPSMGDPRTAVLTFVRDVRRGHCEYFASALALMLRTMGQPTRVAFGFRGGDLQDHPGSSIVRGVHAHVWPEMYLSGLGWVRLEPTPPDRDATDAGTVTQTGTAGGEGVAAGAGRGRRLGDRVLAFDGEAQRRFWGGLAAGVGQVAQAVTSFAFGPAGLYFGWPLLAVTLLLLARRERRARRVREAVGRGRELPPGPYGEALLLLADHGVRRRRVQTSGEFKRTAARAAPAGEGALVRLTRLYERERFGGVAPSAAQLDDGRRDVADLAEALDAKDDAEAQRGGGKPRE